MGKNGQATPPKGIAELVSGVLAPIVARRAAMSVALLDAWSQLAGPQLCDLTRPEKIKWPRRASEADPFEPGILVIACNGAAALRLQHEADIIVERVNTYLGFRAIHRLQILQKPVGIRPDKLPEHDAPLNEEAEQKLSAVLNRIEDPDLRQRLERLGRGVMARSKRQRSQ